MVDLTKLPVEFHPLIPLIQKFSISDDVLRDEKLSKTSAEEKEELCRAVKPLLQKIDKYLDSFGDGLLSEEAAALMYLAEAVAEIINE